MGQPYSQTQALWAITRASFKAIFAQPTAIVFSLLFPIIFILIFGAFGEGGFNSYRVAIDSGSDTAVKGAPDPFYQALKQSPAIRMVRYADTAAMNKDLSSGGLVAVLHIKRDNDTSGRPRYTIYTRATTASQNALPGLQHELDYFKLRYEKQLQPARQEYISLPQTVITSGKKHHTIDFILPGQLGFSILFSTLFGIAFTFYALREQLVLKRFYASPVNRIHILIGIGVSRLFFQLMNVVVLILFGHFFLNFTLEHGALTFIELMIISIVMLFLLMGVGLIFSSIAKSDAYIPLLINVFGFPQMLLSGTFFSISVFPKWLQDICYWLPLTQFNNATRKISFDGLHIFDVWKELGILGIWIIIIYGILARVIRWE